MANLNESLRNMNFESAATRGSTDVTVSAFGNNALKGILEAISRQSSIITSLEDEVESLREAQSKQNNDNRKEDRKNNLASDAANRKSRATNAAMYGEIKKGNVFNKMLREGLMSALEGLTGFLKENLNKALKTQTDLAATMRRANLTHDQKNQIQNLAISMKGILAEDFAKLNISNEQAKDYITDLISAGKDVTRMSKEELAGYMAMRRRNMDADKAYELAKVSSYDSMKNLANSLGDNQIAKSLGNVLSSLDANQRATFGGTDKAIATLTPLVKQLEARAGGVLNSEEVSQIVMAYATKQNPALQASGKLPQGIEALAAVGGNADNIEKFFDNIIASSSYVTSAGDVLSNFAARAKEAEENGHNIRKELYTDKQIEKANETNTAEGKLPNLFENVFNKTLGKVTGPLANTLDEWFGEGVDIAKITGTGFKIVIGLLGSLVAGKFLGGFTSKITSLIGGLGNKLGGPLGKIVGLLGVGGGIAGGDGLEDLLDVDDIDEPDKKKKKKKSKKKGKSKAGKGKGKLGKLSKLGKAGSKIAGGAAKVGAKAIPVAGIAIAAADSAVDLYDAFTWEAESLAVESSSAAFKKMEEGINQSTKNGKVAAATAGAIGTFGGMAAGAAIGSAVPIVGTAIGAVVGLGVGAIASAIADGKEALNNTRIHIANVEDLEKSAKELEDALKTEKDPLRIEELNKALAQTRSDLNFAKDAQMQDLVNKFNDKNEGFANNAEAMSQIGSLLNNSDKEITALQEQLKDLKSRGGTDREIEMLNSQIEAAQKQNIDYRQALTGLAGGEFKINEGESLEAAIKRISADVRGDGWFDTSEAVELAAAESRDKVDAFLKKQALDSLTNGVMHESLDDLKISNADTIEKFVKASNLGAGMSEEALKDLTKEVIKMAKGEDEAIKWEKARENKPVDINVKPNALGGLYTSPTTALIGEDGKEAVLPLEKPGQLFKILNKLTTNERANILTALLSGSSADSLSSMLMKISGSTQSTTAGSHSIANIGGSVPGDDPETIKKILSFAGPFSGFVYNLLLHGKSGKYKNAFEQRKKWYDEALQNAANQEGRDLIRGTYAERALAWGVTQLGKPYILRSLGNIGYVCNELTDAALRASGFDMKDFHIHGVGATFDKLKSGKRSKLKRGDRKGELEEFPDFRIRDDLTFDTATPGMLFFQVAKGKTNPGHIGLVYYGHQKLHSSGGSANYTKGGFLANWQTPCRGVTVTPPKSGEQYIIGELPGLFAQANGEFKLPEGAKFGPGYNSNTAAEAESAKLSALVDESIFTNSASLHDFISQFIGTDYQNLQASSIYSELVADYESAIADIAASSSLEAKRNAIEFSKSALSLLGNKRTSPEILEALSTMIKYLRDIALSPANKKAITPVSRPVNASFA